MSNSNLHFRSPRPVQLPPSPSQTVLSPVFAIAAGDTFLCGAFAWKALLCFPSFRSLCIAVPGLHGRSDEDGASVGEIICWGSIPDLLNPPPPTPQPTAAPTVSRTRSPTTLAPTKAPSPPCNFRAYCLCISGQCDEGLRCSSENICVPVTNSPSPAPSHSPTKVTEAENYNRLSPFLDTPVPTAGEGYVSISACGHRACAVRKGGAVDCWTIGDFAESWGDELVRSFVLLFVGFVA